ncbi:MAG: hypothetical protein IJA36_04860 [Lachnospiraceae bacterium]|nr:hypothetical protein [Lachnospiraceae bacterium]
MKLKVKVVAGLMAGVMLLGGCGAKENSEEDNTSSAGGVEITAEMAEKYVTLGSYDGLELVKYIREVAEEDVEYQKEYFLEDYRVESEVTDRGIENGDYVSFQMTEKPEGSEEADYGTIDIQVGQEEFDAAVDAALLGHKAGETVTTDSVYEEEGEQVKTSYTMVINSVYTISYPEYTDEFVKENTEYATIAELEESFKAAAQQENDNLSLDELRESALSAVVEVSEFKDIPQNLYDSSYEETKELYTSYAEMFGMELADMISEEDLKAEAELSVHQELVVQSIIKAENIQKDDKEYEEYIQKCIKSMEVESEEELNDYYEEGELEEMYFREKALDAIVAKAVVTEAAAPDEEEYEEDEAASEEIEAVEGEELEAIVGEELELDENAVIEVEE